MRAILDRAVDGIITIDEDGNVESFNRSAERMFGYPASEVLGRDIAALIPFFGTEYEGDLSIRGLQAVGRRKDGTELPLEISVSAVAVGERRLVTAILRDVSDRKRQEKRTATQHVVTDILSQSRTADDAVKAIVRALGTGLGWDFVAIWLDDPSAKLLRCAATWSVDPARFQAFVRTSESGSLTRAEGHSGSARGTFDAMWTDSLSGSAPSPRARAAKEAGLFTSLTCPILVNEAFLGVVELLSTRPLRRDEDLMDVMKAVGSQIGQFIERKEAEDALRVAKDAAEQASRAKTDFLANVSHEIRTPLNAILGVADLLWESELDDEQRQYLALFRRAGTNLLVLVNDLLDLSKVEAGQLELKKVDFDVREVVSQALESTSVGAHEKGLKMVGRVSPEVQTILSGDPTRLRQVLVNLVSNAVKFTPRGEVIVDVQRDPGSNDPGTLLFSVKDTGIGIPRDKLEAIFDRFSQVDTSSTRLHGGTGLGLAICRRLVDMMGGRIWAESVLGAGTVLHFTARLDAGPGAANGHGRGTPLSAAGPAPQSRTATGVAPGSRSSAQGPSFASSSEPRTSPVRSLDILLVEDHPDNRLIVQSYLKSSPHRLTIAENGEVAVGAFKKGSFHIVLMDMQMPVMDGYEATRRIRAFEREQGRKPTPIVALTAHALHEEVERTKQAGCDAHLGKPIVKATLLAALEEHASAATPNDEAALATIDPDLLDLVPGYIQNRFRDITACREHLEKGRFEEIRVIAHGMAGSGGAYGFDEITRIGRSLQTAARAKDGPICGRFIDELEAYVRRIHAAHGH